MLLRLYVAAWKAAQRAGTTSRLSQRKASPRKISSRPLFLRSECLPPPPGQWNIANTRRFCDTLADLPEQAGIKHSLPEHGPDHPDDMRLHGADHCGLHASSATLLKVVIDDNLSATVLLPYGCVRPWKMGGWHRSNTGSLSHA